MPKALKKVRFVNNFIIAVVQTVEDDDGRLVAREKSFHIHLGDTYMLSQYEEHDDGRVDLHFPDSSPLAGVAHNVEGDYCELRNPPIKQKATTKGVAGCGGCGH